MPASNRFESGMVVSHSLSLVPQLSPILGGVAEGITTASG